MMGTACLVVLLFLLKTKYRRKRTVILSFLFVTTFVRFIESSTNILCGGASCVHGKCINDTTEAIEKCVCLPGWQGVRCDLCGGRVSLTQPTGFIDDGPGNYSIDQKCTWLINSSQPNATIRLKLHHFVTECSWDHLYIFDGDSAYAPLKAAYSGLIRQETDNSSIPELVTTTGSAYLHFYSDSAYNMSGFRISYSVESCPSNCSGNGICIDGVCTCDGHSTGVDCSIKICPNNCSNHGNCDAEAHKCYCEKGYAGEDCSYLAHRGYWERISTAPPSLWGRASHAATVYKDQMWIFGGERFKKENYCDIWKYDFETQNWSQLSSHSRPQPFRRYGHSVVTYKNYAYIYGGVIKDRNVTNELWRYNYEDNTWLRQPSDDAIACTGHTANIVENEMIIIFGHSSVYSYLNTVQHYDFVDNKWKIANASGSPVKGRFGHSSAYDPSTRKIYVYGGYQPESSSRAELIGELYTYDPIRRSWNEKKSSEFKRYLHSAIVNSNLLIIYGGNTYNDTNTVHGAKCYDSRVLVYDIPCDRWDIIKSPTDNDCTGHGLPSCNQDDYSRHGHSAVLYNDSMYIYGGFNGEMLNSIVKYTFGSCEHFTQNESECYNAGPGVKCAWNNKSNKCLTIYNVELARPTDYQICSSPLSNESICNSQNTCSSCLQADRSCVWCGGLCQSQSCRKSNDNSLKENQLDHSNSLLVYGVKNVEACDVNQHILCNNLHSCQLCAREASCTWSKESMCVVADGKQINKSNSCQPACSKFKDCSNCTQSKCMWCSNLQRCVESNAYNLAFPYGQCMEWLNVSFKCTAPTTCSDAITCDECLKMVNCGWCDDGSRTGVGKCMEGGASNPVAIIDGDSSPAPGNCRTSWHFDSCPACQCNGHSTCSLIPGECDQPCKDQTVGKHCDRCADGFFGNPVNGGNCTPCECNNHGTHCNPVTGRCFCTTKGIVGNNCERCEESGSYTGNPLDGGTCYYKLQIDFQFTFNLSKLEDHYYTQINFFNTPPKADMDADFTINCSVDAFMNVTAKSASKPETAVIFNQSCRNFKYHFSHTEYELGTNENTTIYVYVYDFQTPMSIQIAFTQYPKLDLLQFFITFSRYLFDFFF
ncbi:hypothetical protein CHUAL_008765 [Chamberlinius hualienensis]